VHPAVRFNDIDRQGLHLNISLLGATINADIGIWVIIDNSLVAVIYDPSLDMVTL